MIRKPKIFKDIKQITTWFTDKPNDTWKNIQVEDVKDMIKKWIKFLEQEPQNEFTEYPRGYFQAEILREIFQVGD